MDDKPRSIIMPNDDRAIVSPDKAIITPEEAKERIEQKAKRRFAGANKYNISRDEAVSIAVQIGQEVYDQLRAEHALTMGELQHDLKQHFGNIRNVVATNILDIQRRSFSYRLRRDFAWDRIVIADWVSERGERLRARWERLKLDFITDWQTIVAWLEFYGIYTPPKRTPVIPIVADPRVPPDEVHFRDAEGNTTKIVNIGNAHDEELHHIGAPTELPEAPEVARVLRLDSDG